MCPRRECLSSMKRALDGCKSGKKKDHVLILFTKNSKFAVSHVFVRQPPLFQDHFNTLVTITALNCMHKLSQLSWKYQSIMVKKVINRFFFPATIQQTTPKQHDRDCWDGKKTHSEWCQISCRVTTGNNEWLLPGNGDHTWWGGKENKKK